MKKSARLTSGLVIGAWIAVSLSGCLSNDQRVSNSNTSDDESIALLQTRLKDSGKVGRIVDKLDQALRPVTDVLADVEKILKAGEKEILRDKVNELERLSFRKVQKELNALKRGLVDRDGDGSWAISKEVKWPITRGAEVALSSACARTQLTLRGASEKNGTEFVELLLADCMLPQETPLIRAYISQKMEVDAELNIGDLEMLLKPGMTKGNCSIQSADGIGVQLECAPFSEKTGNLVFDFEKVSVIDTAAGEIMDFALTISEVRDGETKALARATLVKSIGQKTNVKVKRL